jgi:hypothetical protein
MKTGQLSDAEAEEPCSDHLDLAAIDATDGIDDHAAIARSEANILQWMEYLPEDCIARMIAMKWDVTT